MTVEEMVAALRSNAPPPEGVPPGDAALWLKSGQVPAPPVSEPMTRALPGYESMSPHELAALRQRETVRPTAGRAGEGPTIPSVLMSAVAPEAMALRAATHAPKALASALGLATLATPTEAGEATDFKWSDPNADRSKRLDAIDQELKLEAGRVTKSAPGTQAKRMDSLELEKKKLLGERGNEYNDAFSRWQAAESARTETERPFREQYPNAYRMLPTAGWGASALSAILGSRAATPLKSALKGAAYAAPTSAAAAVIPTAYDAATLPTGSKNQQQAIDWLKSPDYWTGRVLPEVGVGMGSAFTGGKFGSQIKEGVGNAAGAVKQLFVPAKKVIKKKVKKPNKVSAIESDDFPDLA